MWPIAIRRLLAVCSAIFVTACSAENSDAPTPGRRHPELEQRLRLHGFRNPEDVRRTILELRAAATRGDKSALVHAIHYPLRRYSSGEPLRSYRLPAEVLANFDAVFSANVLAALRDASYEQLFVRDQGAMIGHGEVWLSLFEEGVRIKAINS